MSELPFFLRAIVTAGGTAEPIDDVRFLADLADGHREPGVTNFSTGAFGELIAQALARRGYPSAFLGGQFVRERPASPTIIGYQRFTSCVDLDAQITALATEPWPLLFMAAAVADYAPVPEPGKISSDVEELVVRMRKNPKILPTLRERFGIGTFIVGFKLLSGAPREALIAAARRQLRTCRTNLCVANDRTQIRDGQHPIIVVTPEGGAIDMTGTREAVAEQLVAFVLRRHHVRWSASRRRDAEDLLPYWFRRENGEIRDGIAESGLPAYLKGTPKSSEVIPAEYRRSEQESNMATGLVDRDSVHAQAERHAPYLLGFAQHAHLLTHATDGNVSLRTELPGDDSASMRLLTTPRQVPKRTLTPGDLIRAQYHLDDRTVHFAHPNAERKPSIDTAVHAWLYRYLPNLGALVHFHDGIVLPTARTTFPYPCGTIEEAEEIAHVLTDAAMRGVYRGGSFAVELTHHGYLLGLMNETLTGDASIWAAWDHAVQAYVNHLAGIGEDALADSAASGHGTLALQPIFRDATIIGVLARETERGFSSCFLLPEYRGDGTGDDILAVLDTNGVRIGAHDRCAVTNYYTARGWKIIGRDGAITLLDPPSLRTDLVPAATVCCFNPVNHSVLIGRRRTAEWNDHWAFPGGSIEAGEAPLAAALRELQEETGIVPPVPHAVDQITSYVGTNGDETAYAVTTFFVPMLHEPTPHRSAEFGAEWNDATRATELRPMGAGTRRVLHHLHANVLGIR